MIKRFRPYFRYLRPQRGLLALAIFCGVVAGLASGAGLPAMGKYVLPRVFAPDAERLGGWALAAFVLWIPVVFLIKGVASYFNTYFLQLVGTRVLEALRLDYFRKLQVLPLSFFQRSTTGDLLSRGMTDANQLQTTLTAISNEIVRSPAALIGSIGFVAATAFDTNGMPAVLVTLAVIPLTVLPIRYIGKKLISRAGRIQTELGAVTDVMTENLSATKEVRAFNLEEREVGRFTRASQTLLRAQMKFMKYEKALTPLIEIIASGGIALTLLYANNVRLPPEALWTLIIALFASYEPIKRLGSLNNDMKRGLGALERLEAVWNAPIAIVDSPEAPALPHARGELVFDRVSFSYLDGEPALREVSQRIPAGTVCALVGPSGAGKTTFANLVPRFFDPTSGAVTLDGRDLRKVRLADLRRNIAIVSQDPVLFNDSVVENLLIARPGASRAEVEVAAKAAYAHDFIERMPQGYDTVIGERGTRLSGGQKQRLAIARAFLRNAPILILDEATSALDSESEAAVQAALRQLVVGKTVLIIAHRFSTIRDASLILVFDQGRIVATGNHAELHRSNDLYRSLYDRQLG